MMDEAEKFNEIQRRVPELMALKYNYDTCLMMVSAVVMPARVRPNLLEMDNATLLGLPIIWDERDRWGLATCLPEGKSDA